MKEKLIGLIEQGLSTTGIAKELGYSQTQICRWLVKYNLKTKFDKHNRKPDNFHCPVCDTRNKEDFYPYERYLCKKCTIERTNNRQKRIKERLVESKGGKCEKCGYDKCIAALQFHHIDPNEKDPDFKKIKGWGWERALKEIEKCQLLCSNCHFETHYMI